MQLFLTLLSTKLAARASRLFGGGGQALPGLVAERLDPHIAGKLAGQLPGGVILVTGTNGKTTTTKMITAVLAAAGERVLTNSTGSNLKRGITSALIGAANVRGVLPYTVAVFEVDEASLRRVAPDLQPKAIVVLNLFRDQLDRYGELDTTAALIGEGIAATSANLYLNADDPLVASLGRYAQNKAQVAFFGIEGLPVADHGGVSTAIDSDRCPICRELLIFDRIFYSHIGHYHCPNGHFNRPQPAVALTNVVDAGLTGTRFTVAIDSRRHTVSYPLPGTYNLYNALAVISLTQGVGIDPQIILTTLAQTQAAFGRVERISVNGRNVCLLLIKNPAGFSQVVETFLLGRDKPTVLFVINDLDADGRDVSWLWDVPLEVLASAKPHITVAGIRGQDMALRLKYAGIESSIAPNIEASIENVLKQTPKGSDIYVLPTYTAMVQVRKVLSKITHIEDVS